MNGGGGCVLIIGNYWLGLIRDKERWKQREEREKLFEFPGWTKPRKNLRLLRRVLLPCKPQVSITLIFLLL